MDETKINMNSSKNSDIFIIELISGLSLGGAERLVAELSSELIANSYKLKLVSLSKNTEMLGQYPGLYDYALMLGISRNPFTFVRGVIKLLQLSYRHQKLVVHAHMFHALVVAVVLKIALPRVQIIFTSHSYFGFSWFRRLFIKSTKCFRSADVIFADGQHPDMNASVVKIIPNFAPRIMSCDVFDSVGGARRESTVFAYIGRMIDIKNPLAIIKSFELLPDGDSQLLLIGEGPLESVAIDYVKSRNLQGRVNVLGPRNDIKAVLENIDVLVMASDWEGLPMIILEAGSRGLTVIAPPVGAIPQILGDGCGYLCSPNDLADVMHFVLGNKIDAKIRGQRLQERIKDRYSVESALSSHLDLYCNCLDSSVTKGLDDE